MAGPGWAIHVVLIRPDTRYNCRTPIKDGIRARGEDDVSAGRPGQGAANSGHASPCLALPRQSHSKRAPPSPGGSQAVQAARVTLRTGRLPLQDQLAVFSSHPCCAPPRRSPRRARRAAPGPRHTGTGYWPISVPSPVVQGRHGWRGSGRAGRGGVGPKWNEQGGGVGRIEFGRGRFCLASGVCNANPTDLQHSLNLSKGDF